MVEMVTVMCRLPHGLILQTYPEGEIARRANLSKEGRPDRSPLRGDAKVTLNGAVSDSRYHPKENRLLGMCGRTLVEKPFWDKWLAQHADSDLVKNHCVFAEQTDRRASDKAADFATEKTGYEPEEPEAMKARGIEAAK